MSTATAIASTPFNITVTEAGPAAKKISIEIPEAVIAERITASYGNYQKFAQLPGFRPGRAPRRLIEQKFGATIKDEVAKELVSESYQAALKDNNLDAISNPEVDGTLTLPASGPLTFAVTIEVTPDFKLPAFETLEVKKKAFPVTDADVTAEIKSLGERQGTPTTPEGAVEAGDYVGISLKVLAGHNAADDAEVLLHLPATYALVNGADKEFKGHLAGILVENLGKELAGKTKGDVVRINVAGPTAHENIALVGKELTLVLTIDSLHRIVPASAEQIATKLNFASVAELETKIKEELTQRAEVNQKADLFQQITEQLLTAANFDLPAKVATTQAQRILMRTRYEMLSRGISEEVVEQKLAEMRGESDAEAKKQLKQFFVLDKASKELGIEVDEAEINGRIAMMAFQQNRRPDKMREEMAKNMQIEQLYLQIREQKTLDAALEKAKVVDA